MGHAVEHGLHRFLTLTLDPAKVPHDLTLQERVAYLRECWRKMRVYIQRKLGRSLTFVSVVEFHQNGMPHLHALIGSFLPQQWISESWQAVGGGRIVDIRHVEIRRVAAYMSKYITKQKLLDAFPDGVRRFSTSRGLSLFNRSQAGGKFSLHARHINSFYATSDGIDADSERYEVDLDGRTALVAFSARGSPLTKFAVFRKARSACE